MSRFLPQSGVGIELCSGTLRAVFARSFWNKVRVIDSLEISAYREAGGAECGRRYREFLRRNGLQSPWTVVALPRPEVLVRSLRFPASMEKELSRALELQLDTLHPFEPGTVIWDAAPVVAPKPVSPLRFGSSSLAQAAAPLDVIVGLARRDSVMEMAEWFREAGIPVSQFALSTTLLLTLFRSSLGSNSVGGAMFVLHIREDGCELIGHLPGTPVVSHEIPTDADAAEADLLSALTHEVDLARSALRLQPDERSTVVLCGGERSGGAALHETELPGNVVWAENVLAEKTGAMSKHCLAIAAATAAVTRGASERLNLLPPERRSYRSPLAYAPTYALAGLVILLAAALTLRGSVQDWIYSRHLERELAALRPQIENLERLQGESRETYSRLTALAGFSRTAELPLELLDELTRILPPDAWLQQLQYDGNAVTLSGTAQSASAVLQALTSSSHLESPQFSASLTRTAEGREVFRIGARLRVANP